MASSGSFAISSKITRLMNEQPPSTPDNSLSPAGEFWMHGSDIMGLAASPKTLLYHL